MSNTNKTVVLYENSTGQTDELVAFYLIDGDYSHLDQTFFDIDDPHLEGWELKVKNLRIGEDESSKVISSREAKQYIKEGAELAHFGCYN